MPATRIEVTDDLLTALCEAQANHTAAVLRNHDFFDDGGDYTNSALDVMTALFHMRWDQSDLDALDKYLNTPPGAPDGMIDLPQSGGKTPHLWYCASDGVCEALWRLKCPALDDRGD